MAVQRACRPLPGQCRVWNLSDHLSSSSFGCPFSGSNLSLEFYEQQAVQCEDALGGERNEPAIEFIWILFSCHVKVQADVSVEAQTEIVVHHKHFCFVFTGCTLLLYGNLSEKPRLNQGKRNAFRPVRGKIVSRSLCKWREKQRTGSATEGGGRFNFRVFLLSSSLVVAGVPVVVVLMALESGAVATRLSWSWWNTTVQRSSLISSASTISLSNAKGSSPPL